MKNHHLKLGPPDGPWIDILSLNPPVPSIEQIEQLVSQPYMPQIWGAAHEALPPQLAKSIARSGYQTIVGYFEKNKLIISLTFPQRTNGIDALRAIEEHQDKPLPAGLTAALVATLSAKKPCLAPSTFAYYANNGPTEKRAPLNRTQIDEAAERWLNEMLVSPNAKTPINGIDRGRMFVPVATKLWDKEIAKRIGNALNLDSNAHLLALSPLAEAARVLRDMTELSVSAQQLKLIDKAEAWPQYLELVRGDISGQAVQFLCGSSFPQTNEVLSNWLGDSSPANALVIEDSPSATAWAKSLVRDATENGVFVPSGGFRLAFPRGYPLREWGLLGLRIHADPQGLWVSTHPNRGENVFRWEPGTELRPILMTSKIIPLMEITLAALWRDMQVAGETVVRPRVGRGTKTKSKEQRKTEPTVRYLPRRRLIFHDDTREWGSPEEHEVIQRRRHGVSEHFRRLLTGQEASEGARKNADDFGYALIPDGYTFVKPHVRGHGEEEAKKTVTVVAQGLQAATIFLDKQADKQRN